MTWQIAEIYCLARFLHSMRVRNMEKKEKSWFLVSHLCHQCHFLNSTKASKFFIRVILSFRRRNLTLKIALQFKIFRNIFAFMDQVFWINFRFQVPKFKFRYLKSPLKYLRITRAQFILILVQNRLRVMSQLLSDWRWFFFPNYSSVLYLWQMFFQLGPKIPSCCIPQEWDEESGVIKKYSLELNFRVGRHNRSKTYDGFLIV